MGRVSHVLAAQRFVGDPADGDDATFAGELGHEPRARFDLGTGRPAVARLGARMRRDDVPEEDVFLELELGEHTLDDRRRRLGGACAGQLALRGEGNARDARTPIARRLSDEEEGRAASLVQIPHEPFAKELRT